MNVLRAFIELIKMLYNLLWYSANLVTFLFNLFWLICTLASAGIPWFTLILLTVCIASKFIKLKSPNEKILISLLGGDSVDDLSYWPIANRGGAYDAPENSMAALKKVKWLISIKVKCFLSIIFVIDFSRTHSSVRHRDLEMSFSMPRLLLVAKLFCCIRLHWKRLD